MPIITTATVGNYSIFVGAFGAGNAVDIFNASTGQWLPPPLPSPRHGTGITTATVGNYAIFAGGFGANGISNAVDIFNASTGQWLPPTTLSQARGGITAATVGNYAIFAGGSGDDVPSNAVDIFNASTGQWSTTTLSQARYEIAAATVGNYAIFAGGYGADGDSNAADIFNASTGQWLLPTTTLSEARYNNIITATVGNYAIFAGGFNANGISNAVDIFNASTGQWLLPATTLSQARAGITAATVGNYAIFAGGPEINGDKSTADIFNASTGRWLPPATLSQGGAEITTATVGNYAIFAGGFNANGFSNAADIFNASTGQWLLPPTTVSQARTNITAATVGTYAIFAGGSGANGDSNAVDIFNASTGQWLLPPTTLSETRGYLTTATVGNYAIFAEAFGAGNGVDIFNASTGQWLLPPTTLSQARGSITTATVGNYAIFAGGIGANGYSNAADFSNASTGQWLTAPALILSAPSNASYVTASIGYTLIDEDSNPCSIQVQYSVNGGPWQVATEATGAAGDDGSTALTSSPTGMPHTFVWNTAADLGNTNNPSVQIRITPEDGTTFVFGETQASGSFAVNNSGVVNALLIDDSGDSKNDAIKLVQNGSTISFSGTLAGATSTNMTGTATNMTSVTVRGGGGINTLDASQTIMPVTLNGGPGSGADTLIGGAGSDIFYCSGPGSTYDGGSSADNTIAYPANPNDVITVEGKTLSVNGTFEYLANVSGIENLFVSGSPASVNNSQQRLWPIEGFPLLYAAINGMTTTQGFPSTVLTAGFSDPNPYYASLSTESATINWGDGTTSTGTVASTGGGNFTITGSHIYATNASRVVSATIVDSLGSATTVGATYSGGLLLDGSGNLLNQNGTTSSTVDTGVKSFVVDEQDPTPTVFTLHADGSLWEIAGSNLPQQIDSGVVSIRIGPDGTLYVLHNDDSLTSFAPGATGSQSIDGSFQAVVTDSQGDIDRLDTNGSLQVLPPGSDQNWATLQASEEADAAVSYINTDSSGNSVDVVYTNGDG